jgi:hypothetical protein
MYESQESDFTNRGQFYRLNLILPTKKLELAECCAPNLTPGTEANNKNIFGFWFDNLEPEAHTMRKGGVAKQIEKLSLPLSLPPEDRTQLSRIIYVHGCDGSSVTVVRV